VELYLYSPVCLHGVVRDSFTFFTVLHNKEVCYSYRLPTASGISESLELRWAGYVARMKTMHRAPWRRNLLEDEQMKYNERGRIA
jgi:hypothetical protein